MNNQSTTVLVDATSITPKMKGVGRYAYQICEELIETRPQNCRVVILSFCSISSVFPYDAGASFVELNYMSEFQLGMRTLPRLLRKTKASVLIRPADKIGKKYSVRTLTVCHDLNRWIWNCQPNRRFTRQIIDATWERLRINAIKASDVVVCNSQFVRQGVLDHFGVRDERTTIGYCGVDRQFIREIDLVTPLDLPPSIPRKTSFLLAFATGDAREGSEELPGIFKEACSNGYSGNLVIAGVNSEIKQKFHAIFRQYGLLNRVFTVPFLGPAELRQLVSLYKFAEFYIETSYHEGFGMQLVEAMVCGTTCFSSERGALREVGGSFPILLQIDNHKAAGQAIARASLEGEGCRDNSSQVSFARKYDWSKTRKIISEFAWGS